MTSPLISPPTPALPIVPVVPGITPSPPLGAIDPAVRQRVARLMSRAGFGASITEIDRLAAGGYKAAVDQLLSFAPEATRPDRAEPLAWQVVGHGLDIGAEDPSYHQAWWLSRMADSAYPLEEKLTLYLHGHFATAYSKVTKLGPMMLQNRTLRENAGGNFRTLLNIITADPAMLWYLDGEVNRVGFINENYGREFMELFTLGKARLVNGVSTPNYTQSDVRESARAFTGYTTDRMMKSTFEASRHDDKAKTILGQTGRWGPADVVNIVLDQHPAGDVSAAYVATRVASFFEHPNPEPEVIDAMVKAFTRKRAFDIKPMMRALFMQPAFYDGPLRTIKTPAEVIAGAVKALGQNIVGTNPAAFTNLRELAALCGEMGQQLFNPPNVSGWRGGAAWANTATMVARYNMASKLSTIANNDLVYAVVDLAGGVDRTTTRLWMDRLGIIALSPKTQSAIDGYLSAAKGKNDASTTARGVLTLLLASPDYNLR